MTDAPRARARPLLLPLLSLALGCAIGIGVATRAGWHAGPGGEDAQPGAVTLRFFGHAAFEITASTGARLLTDPYPERLGLGALNASPQVVTVSHPHWDHAEVLPFPTATVLQGLEIDGRARRVSDARLSGTFGAFRVAAFGAGHDPPGRQDLGRNAIFRIVVDGLAIVHAGDLGRVPDQQTLGALQPVDVLLVPVGGGFTLDASGAAELIRLLAPRIAIPMHYALPGLAVPLQGIEKLRALLPAIAPVKGSTVSLKRAELPPPTRIVVLEPERRRAGP